MIAKFQKTCEQLQLIYIGLQCGLLTFLWSCGLERQLERELDQARVARVGDRPEIARRSVHIRPAEAVVVSNVEGFGAELQANRRTASFRRLLPLTRPETRRSGIL